MDTVQKSTVGKNALWDVYKNADPLVRDEIILRLKKVDLFRHWLVTASKEGYNLKKKGGGQLRDIFVELIPDTAPYFGIDTKN